MDKTNNYWKWKQWDIAWSKSKNAPANSSINILLIHGFGASQRHWRNNQDILGSSFNCYYNSRFDTCLCIKLRKIQL